MVVQWLARLPHSQKVLCLHLRAFVGLLWVLQLSLTDQRHAIWLSGDPEFLNGVTCCQPCN